VNPSYGEANSDGWSGSVPNHSGYNRTDMVEYWRASFNQYQTLYSLPAGMYELKVNAYNRYKDNATTDYNAFTNGEKNSVQTLKIYIVENGDTTAIQGRMIGEGARESIEGLAGGYSDITLEDGTLLHTPNNMQGAGACFEQTDENADPLSDEMNYVNRIVFELTEDTDVIIGIRNDDATGWSIWDNWGLTYFGTESTKEPTVGIEAIEGTANAKSVDGKSIYNLNGQRLAAPQKGINIIGGKKVLVK